MNRDGLIPVSRPNDTEWFASMRRASAEMPDPIQYLLDKLHHAEHELTSVKNRLAAYEDPGAAPSLMMNGTTAAKFLAFIREIVLERVTEKILDRIVEGVREVFGYDRVGLMLYDDASGRIVGYRSIGLPEEYIRSLNISPEDTDGVQVAHYIAKCFSSGAPILVGDRTAETPYNIRMDETKREYSSQYAVAPIAGREKKFGIFTVAISPASKLFLTETDLVMISFFGHQIGVALENAKLSDQIEDFYRGLILTFSNMVEVYDETTFGHCDRLIELSRRLGERLGMDEPTLRELELAASLHDIGKLGVPGYILQKPGALTKDEYEIVKTHARIGAKMVAPLKRYRGVVDAVKHHHERWDGKGYPDRLLGEEIPLFARIIALADAYDVIMSRRPYKEACDRNYAISELTKNAGTQFDPTLTELFLRLLDEEKE